ncbi:MAG: dehypoxanthine futalosine cyclase [Acidobacteria bacterium]|nr:dehypoxanthine futalosine cyclase [Acidobacteriota bacterium]
MLRSEEAADLLAGSDLIGLGMAADEERRRLHPEGVVTYVIDRNINYSNVCASGCDFCAFWRPPEHGEAYVLDRETLYQKIRETLAVGGTGILMQGGLHPGLKIEWYEDLLRDLKRRFRIHLHCFSSPEILHIARASGLSLRESLQRLTDAGLDSIPGGGAEILDDEVRQRISRRKCSTAEWLEVHREAHRLGLPSTATMMFGCGETLRQRVNHLEAVRRLQEETGGFTAFIPWTFQHHRTALGQVVKEEVTAVEYLKTLAVARLYLDNIANLQASWVTQGLKICQVALRFGANDVGSIMLEENVVRATGVQHRASEEELRRIIRDAGFVPRQRDTLYRVLYLS